MEAEVASSQWYESSSYAGFPYLNVQVQVRATIGCADQVGLSPAWVINVQYLTTIVAYDQVGGFVGPSTRLFQLRRNSTGLLDNYCQIVGDRKCQLFTPGDRGQFLTTPLTFTADGKNLSLPHTFSESTYNQYFPAGEAATWEDFANDIRDAALSATFRITSRDNCLPVVDCDCESNTDGLKILFNEQPFFSFFLFDGDTELQTFSDLGAYYTLFYQPSANDWVITYEQNNPSNTELYYRITARIFCEAVPGGVPSPFRWYYSLESECFEWEDGSITKNTKETWVGHFNCEEDPCGTNGRAAGDLYPVGLPRDVVSLGRTTPEGYAACNPSGGITELLIINDAECP
jgi:hypothetical protein